ncbi:MAG: Ribulose-5-phosphate 4-epimerase and related epimerases and aldolases, partial [uncultured Ramlibacter sp.]
EARRAHRSRGGIGRRVAGARRPGGLLPAHADLRHERPDLQPHHGADPRRGRPHPDQPVRLPVRRDHRVEPGDDRPGRQHR